MAGRRGQRRNPRRSRPAATGSRTGRWPRSAARRCGPRSSTWRLLAGETDCSVHSMKDVESERPETLLIAAMLPARRRTRPADRRGVASPICRKARWSAPARRAGPRSSSGFAPTSTSSRSAAMSIPGWPNARTGEVDATLLAAAGLDRLGRGEVGMRDRARRNAAGARHRARSASNAAPTTA